MRINGVTFLILHLLLACPRLSADGEETAKKLDGSRWRYRQALTISPSTPEPDYQIRVELDPSVFRYEDALADGRDLRACHPDGTSLSNWIERWNVSGRSTVWVRVPAAGTDRIELWYGNPMATSASSAPGTFIDGTDFTADHGFTFSEDGVSEPFGDQSGSLRHGRFGSGDLWDVTHRIGGRLDAIAYLGRGVLVIGTRGPRPGHIFRSRDHGRAWSDLGQITKSEILNVLDAGGGTTLVSTTNGDIFRSTDSGLSWSWQTRLSQHRVYSMARTRRGAIVASDTDSSGGHVFRSTDRGRSWKDLGPVTKDRAYRFVNVEGGLLLNGWDGHVYKSTDEGKTWSDRGKLSSTPLYAIEYVGDGVALLGDDTGNVFRSSDDGDTWKKVGTVGAAADDFVALGSGVVVFTTYKGNRHLHISRDAGLTWRDIGDTNTSGAFDHVIRVNDEGLSYGIGGTTTGYVLRTTSARDALYVNNVDRTELTRVSKRLSTPQRDGFALRAKLTPFGGGKKSGGVHFPILGLGVTDEQIADGAHTASLTLILFDDGFRVVEYAGNGERYTTLHELVETPPASGPRVVEIRKRGTMGELHVFDEDLTPLGTAQFKLQDPRREYSYLLPYQPGSRSWKGELSSHLIEYVVLRRLAAQDPMAKPGRRVTGR